MWLAAIAFPGGWVITVSIYVGRGFLPVLFRKFGVWPTIWIHMSCIISADVVASILNVYIGRVRPTFYSRCGSTPPPDRCPTLSAEQLIDEKKSFPSLTVTTAMSSCLFLTLFLQKITLKRPAWLSCGSLVFVALGMRIGATEITAFQCHVGDVVAGFAIGAVCTGLIWVGSVGKVFRHLKHQQTDDP
jgi:membrane-associated phospholipid phosphatase